MNPYLVIVAALAFFSGLALVGYAAIVWDRRRNRALARRGGRTIPVDDG